MASRALLRVVRRDGCWVEAESFVKAGRAPSWTSGIGEPRSYSAFIGLASAIDPGGTVGNGGGGGGDGDCVGEGGPAVDSEGPGNEGRDC